MVRLFIRTKEYFTYWTETGRCPRETHDDPQVTGGPSCVQLETKLKWDELELLATGLVRDHSGLPPALLVLDMVY